MQLYAQRFGEVPLPILSRSPDNVLVLISKEIRSKMLIAYGRHSLVDPPMKNQAEEFFNFVQASTDAEFFDFIELIFQTETYRQHAFGYVQPHELVEDINKAFEMEAVPYKLTALTAVSPAKTPPIPKRNSIIQISSDQTRQPLPNRPSSRPFRL